MPSRPPASRTAGALLLILFMLLPRLPLRAYSVLSHEQIVDFVWNSDIKKILLKRYPNATPEDLIRRLDLNGVNIAGVSVHSLLTTWGFSQKQVRLARYGNQSRRAWVLPEVKLASIERELADSGSPSEE